MQQGAKISQARLSVLMGRTGSRSRKALPKNSSGLVKNKAPGAPRSTNTLRFLEATIKHNDTPHFCSAAATGAQSPATPGAPGRATTDQSLARIVPAQPGTRDCPCPAWTVPAQPALGTGKNLGPSLSSQDCPCPVCPRHRQEPGTLPAQPGTWDQPCWPAWNPGSALPGLPLPDLEPRTVPAAQPTLGTVSVQGCARAAGLEPSISQAQGQAEHSQAQLQPNAASPARAHSRSPAQLCAGRQHCWALTHTDLPPERHQQFRVPCFSPHTTGAH